MDNAIESPLEHGSVSDPHRIKSCYEGAQSRQKGRSCVCEVCSEPGLLGVGLFEGEITCAQRLGSQQPPVTPRYV